VIGDVRDLVRLAVGGEHDLLVVLVERVERWKNGVPRLPRALVVLRGAEVAGAQVEHAAVEEPPGSPRDARGSARSSA
jgi:hypothetical protein